MCSVYRHTVTDWLSGNTHMNRDTQRIKREREREREREGVRERERNRESVREIYI